MIGTDPEFVLCDRYHDLMSARRFTFFSSTKRWSKIGCDGAGTPVEIRTTPVAINKIGIMLNDMNTSLNRISRFCEKRQYRLYAGAWKKGCPIGGHLHFGHSDLINDIRINEYNKPALKLVHLLDCYFTPIMNHFISADEISKRLKHSGYGRLGQFRIQDYGIEYRTPYSFLLSPLLTSSMFSLACLLASHYKTTKVDTRLQVDMEKYYEDLSPKRLEKILKTIKPKILKMMSWYSPNPRHNSQILTLFSLIERGKKIKSHNILKNYKFNNKPPTKFTIYYVGSDEILRKIKYKLDRAIHNKNKGEIEIRNHTRVRQENIYLTEGLPKIPNIPLDYDIKYIKKGEIHKIELSDSINHLMVNRPKNLKFLINYLNGLKL